MKRERRKRGIKRWRSGGKGRMRRERSRKVS
jgi:hypothetical protein